MANLLMCRPALLKEHEENDTEEVGPKENEKKI